MQIIIQFDFICIPFFLNILDFVFIIKLQKHFNYHFSNLFKIIKIIKKGFSKNRLIKMLTVIARYWAIEISTASSSLSSS